MHHPQFPPPALSRHTALLPNPFKIDCHGFRRTSHACGLTIVPSLTYNSLLFVHAHNCDNNQSQSTRPLPSSQTQTKLWESRIELQLRKSNYQKCISLYYQIVDELIAPSPATVVHVLMACSSLSDLKNLRLVHNDILRLKLESHSSVAAGLLDGYFKCGLPEAAHRLFDTMPRRDVVSWTIVISHSYKSGNFDEAIHYFRAMIDEGVSPDDVALVSILSALKHCGRLRHGSEVHGYLMRRFGKLSKATISSLVDFYAKLGRMDCADRFLSQTIEPNVVAWTALMTGYTRVQDMNGALQTYLKMVSSHIVPTERTISCALGAVSKLGFLRIGTQIHGYIVKRQFELDDHILSGLIDMYSICGAPSYICRQLFDQMFIKNVVSWTTMILAYGRSGEGHAALQLFNDMQAAGVCPDSVAFTAILSACSSSSMLHDGLSYFNSMILDYTMKPREEHYACLRGLLAKDGRLKEAYEAIESTALRDDKGTWEAFLGACRVHGNTSYGEIAATKLVELESDNSTASTVGSDDAGSLLTS
ncbi:pentatricopeptide repeat-containing protein At1g06140, mitochondrial-like isoform X1 [Phoenix dactylifera]|uniref:Pentatricopeptide repeat-containing protein At1g06140, mitochondrial-like isoform X1 n=1 Tax=Phoenix dactylifera TaxID=42345 RepID=A0A8B7CLZ8_PHODC|nr:pentatricopeptide repeat-containing protein At1g06140, mitochondrial-like isoform X1 [Phoenix dactylifera]XP_026663846.1 pentatricopeptide repeat-containing protein At1g06140, mitochondrial-like isoform X1 [Phoenix dactylifera]XP_026663847.1 pentatricopeptide repeat-containing protein At1g06140, mitochondrial-like isoform X1 [Phoenix dactylifera]